MILTQYKSLWNKIQNFSFDDPDAVITFSSKLASQNNWSAKFTERVVEEYRKFLFLCCISPHGASPSPIVDEAWHLHLTFTQSYWTDLCKNTLGKDLHHHPSKGGFEEKHKHEKWYCETIQLYQQVFEQNPPSDIWPAPTEKSTNTESLHIPPATYSLQIKTIAAFISSLPFLYISYSYQTLYPFSLAGPEFLEFFSIAGIVAIVIFRKMLLIKGRALQQELQTFFPQDANVFQLAKFLYGKHRAIQTCIVDLIRRNLLEVNDKKIFTISNNSYTQLPNEQNPLMDEMAQRQNGETVTYRTISQFWYNEEKFSHSALDKLQNLARQKESIIKKYFPIIIVMVFGIIRLVQGLYNERPVDFLMLEITLFLLVTFIINRYLSSKAVIFKKADELYAYKLTQGRYYHDSIVSDFAARGSDALLGFREGILLGSMFGAYPVLHQYGIYLEVTNSFEGSGGDGDGGDGGCGGGCGGCGGD